MDPVPHASLWHETGDIVLQVRYTLPHIASSEADRGDLHWQAGDTLFKLERSVLRNESQFFADMLTVGSSGLRLVFTGPILVLISI